MRANISDQPPLQGGGFSLCASALAEKSHSFFEVKMITLQAFDMDRSVVAPCIYEGARHRVSERGVSLASPLVEELRRMLRAYNKFLKVREPYYRIDAYFDQDSLSILEINAAFVDGWGTALNLARASNIPIDPNKLRFPFSFATVEEAYLPELELFVRELEGHRGERSDICNFRDWAWADDEIYVYGRVPYDETLGVLPRDGLRLDDKRNLARFEQERLDALGGKRVRIPRHYMASTTPWEAVPSDVVLKFCNKDGPEARQARQSVIIGKPQGKAKFLRGCYEQGSLIAQTFVPPFVDYGDNTQIVILAIGDEPVTGYVQYSAKQIINDNSVHGPLAL